MRIGRRLTAPDQSASRVRQLWPGEMNFPAANTFPFQPSPSWFNAQVGERRLPVRKLSAFCWIDTQVLGLGKTASHFSRVRLFRVIFLLPSLPRSARFHLHTCNTTRGRPKQ